MVFSGFDILTGDTKKERAVTRTPDTPGSARRSGYRLREILSCLKNWTQYRKGVSVGFAVGSVSV